ncbi:unannotated protein [freshwater metagenome]|uniref:Unannotated protein n=1 Tax=freshwater metagenome TaxID=449393 RepID=A0A6J6EIH9_9ZZZZ
MSLRSGARVDFVAMTVILPERVTERNGHA